MIREERTAQMRVTVRHISEGTKGSNFWAAPARARYLIGRGEARMLNDIPRPATTGILERSAEWPLDRFSKVLPHWKGRRVVILGGGPSLTPEQFAAVGAARTADRIRVIGINDAYLCAPWADVLYFADSEWWTWQTEGKPKPKLGLSGDDVRQRFADFRGEKCSIQNTGMNIDDAQVHMLRNLHGKANMIGLSRDPMMIASGGHSGFQGINLAYLAGALDIILCGFDAREPERREPGEHSHWFGDHPKREPGSVYPLIRESFRAAAHHFNEAGLRIKNASATSLISAFRKCELQTELDALGDQA